MGRTLRILYVGTLPPHRGGSAISAAGLLAGLVNLGHAVHALAPVTPETWAAARSFEGANSGMVVTRFEVPFFEINPYTPAEDGYRQHQRDRVQAVLAGLIGRVRPDLLFVGRETFAWDVPKVAEVHRLPALLRIAGGTLIGLAWGAYPTPLARGLLSELARMRLLTAPSEHLVRTARQLGLGNVVLIPNAVDLRLFALTGDSRALRRALEIQDEDVVVVHASNLKPVKRPFDIARSAALAIRRDARLVYVIVGDGPLRGALEEACRDEGIHERFRFVGWVEYERMPDYLRLADIVIMPSEAEGMSRVYLEAQACGRVLVASDIPPAREVVMDGDTGLLFPLGNIDGLASRTLEAAGDPALRAHIGQRARTRVQAHALQDAVTRYAAWMEHLVAESEMSDWPTSR